MAEERVRIIWGVCVEYVHGLMSALTAGVKKSGI
jgi:hypothetical protein